MTVGKTLVYIAVILFALTSTVPSDELADLSVEALMNIRFSPRPCEDQDDFIDKRYRSSMARYAVPTIAGSHNRVESDATPSVIRIGCDVADIAIQSFGTALGSDFVGNGSPRSGVGGRADRYLPYVIIPTVVER